MKLLISFKDQSASFTNGVEVGRILEKMQRGDLAVSNNGMPVHTANVETIKEMCEVFKYAYLFTDTEIDEWVDFTALKIQHSGN